MTNVGNAYLEGGLDSALYDEERSGRPIDFDDRERSRIVAMVCSQPPRGFYRWTLDLIVEEAQKRQLVDGQISRETHTCGQRRKRSRWSRGNSLPPRSRAAVGSFG